MQRVIKFSMLIFAVVLAVVLGRLAFKAHQPEASYLGKPASYWLSEGFTYSLGVEGRPPAESAFRFMSSNSVPFLTAALARTDGPLEQVYLGFYPKLPIKLRMRLPQPVAADVLRRRAICALMLIGPPARAAIPSLLNVLTNDPDKIQRSFAVACLDAIDNGDLQDEVVDAWKQARSDVDPLVARSAANVLARHFPLGFLPLDDTR
jgi:HEAT repeat protein